MFPFDDPGVHEKLPHRRELLGRRGALPELEAPGFELFKGARDAAFPGGAASLGAAAKVLVHTSK